GGRAALRGALLPRLLLRRPEERLGAVALGAPVRSGVWTGPRPDRADRRDSPGRSRRGARLALQPHRLALARHPGASDQQRAGDHGGDHVMLSAGAREAPRDGAVEAGPAVVAPAPSKSSGGRLAVDGFDFVVGPGICFGFLGPNGAGKTTTMKMMYGLATVDAGELRVLDLDSMTDRREIKSRIGVVPQETNLDGDLTVRE